GKRATGGRLVLGSRRGERPMIRDRVRVAVVGDFHPANRPPRFPSDALAHVGLAAEWVPTDAPGDWGDRLSRFNGVWIAPASAYRSMDGALTAIRYAREGGGPLGGAGGGSPE